MNVILNSSVVCIVNGHVSFLDFFSLQLNLPHVLASLPQLNVEYSKLNTITPTKLYCFTYFAETRQIEG